MTYYFQELGYMNLDKKQSLAVIRLHVLSQMLLDDMETLKEYPLLYRGNMKPLVRQLSTAIQQNMKSQIEKMYSEIDSDVVNIQYSLDKILKFVIEMDTQDINYFAQSIEAIREELNNLK